MQNVVQVNSIDKKMYQDINYVLNLPYVEGIPFETLSQDSSNENLILLGLYKSYSLLAIKQNKKRRFDTELVKKVTMYFISQVNKWNTKSVIDILLNRNSCSDIQNFFWEILIPNGTGVMQKIM